MDEEFSRYTVINESLQQIELFTDSLDEAKEYIKKILGLRTMT